MLICDWCEIPATLSDLSNVDYLDGNGNEIGLSNVLCEYCVEESKRAMGEELVHVWK